MDNTLANYMNKRFGAESKRKETAPKISGPVITISREVGCGGVKFGRKLAQELDKNTQGNKWQVVSKEVLRQSAQELKLSTEKVARLFSARDHFTMDEILAAFTDKYYKSNRVILKTVKDVIHNFADEGRCIIVGRAGHIIASDIENSLHLRFIAPLDWRVESISQRKNLSKADALKYIESTEKERGAYRKHYLKDREEMFDLVVDVSKFPDEKLIALILKAYELKGTSESMKKKTSFV